MRTSLPLAAAALLGAALLAGCDSSTFVDPSTLNCDHVSGYSVGRTSSGTLSTGDCQLNDGAAVDYYRFTFNRIGTVHFVEESGTIDPYVAVLDANGNLVAEEDNAGSGFSELTTTLGPGTYYLAASSYQPGDYGSYTVTSSEF